MGTSNWQHIPFCVEVLMKIEPKRVLDVGVGFGRWGIIVREFCDVWFGRVLPEQWSVYIEGIEVFEPNISPYHKYFYNKIHIGDALDIIPGIDELWDVVIFGNIIEHFTRDEGERLLRWSIDHSKYVIVNVPLGDDWQQEEMYNNPYERHKSIYKEDDFSSHLARKSIFQDYIGRKHGSFVLSREDPRGISKRLFSQGTDAESYPQETIAATETDSESLQKIVTRAQAIVNELNSIKSSRSYRAMTRIQRSMPGRLASHALRYVDRYVRPEQRLSTMRGFISQFSRHALSRTGVYLSEQSHPLRTGYTRLKVIGRNPQSQGAEVWILAVRNNDGFLALDRIHPQGDWTVKEGLGMEKRPALVASEYGWSDIPAGNGAHLMLLRHPWSGIVELQHGNMRRRFDLYTQNSDHIIVDLTTLDQKHAFPSIRVTPIPEADRSWLQTIDRRQEFIAIVNPEWKGIYSSTKNLFDNILELPDDLNENKGLRYARLIAETNCRIVVIQGYPLTYDHLVSSLRRIAPKVRIAVIWHGTFLQHNEDYAWQSFRRVEQLASEGVIWKWGFVKARMAEIMARRGIQTGFIQNMVREIPDKPSKPLEGGPHFGIWLLYANNWRKNPFASIAAVSMFPSATLHTSATNDRVQEFIQLMNIKSVSHGGTIEQHLIRQYFARMHLNLYVTLSECAPMLPLESLSVGSPCLIGPNSYYFEDNDYLHQRLVVPQPDDAGLIAAYIQQALEERDEIIRAYIEYAPGYNQRAQELLANFLELDIDSSHDNP